MRDLYIGVDWGNSKSRIFALDNEGEIVLECDVASLETKDWQKHFRGLKDKDYRLQACFEIGPQYEWLYDLLKRYCAEVVCINPADFAVIARSQKKTDKIDAQKLAEGLRRGDLPSVYVPEKAVREDRRLVAFIHWHSQQTTCVKGKIRSLLLTFRLNCPYANVGGSRGLAWLENTAKEKLDAQSVLFLDQLIDQLKLLNTQRGKLDTQIAERLNKYSDAPIVDSVPGIGPLGTLAIVSSIVNIGRFETPGELSSYFGLCGRIHQSGKTLIQGPLTKRGNTHVRWLLSQALLHLHKKDPKAKRRYDRLKKRKHRGVARAAQARWLTSILWQMLRKKEKYRINVAGKPSSEKQSKRAKLELSETPA